MNTDALPAEAEEFLRELRLGLAPLPREERDEIVAEVRSHFRDRRTTGKTPILAGFEDAQSYASRFVSESALQSALARGTSLELGRALLVGARTGLMWMTVVPVVTAQLMGALLVLAGALKPFIPSRIGLFLDTRGRFVALGMYGGDTGRLHELLGYWAVPLFIAVGISLLWGGNRLLRSLAKWRLSIVRARSSERS